VNARLSPPRYERIASSLKERIEAGEFDDELPGIGRLRADYAVGRRTVGRALAILVKDGVAKRQAGCTYAVTRKED
jgi:DNA-binding GntR family transcriptional regulator